jgi:hypothetical protein
MGFFEDVQVEVQENKAGTVVTFVLREKPAISKIYVAGAEEVALTKINEVLDIKKDQVLDLAKLKKNVEKIKDLYVEKGRLAQDVVQVVDRTTGEKRTFSWEVRITRPTVGTLGTLVHWYHRPNGFWHEGSKQAKRGLRVPLTPKEWERVNDLMNEDIHFPFSFGIKMMKLCRVDVAVDLTFATSVGASVGVYFIAPAERQPTTGRLHDLTDELMYQAKRRGGGLAFGPPDVFTQQGDGPGIGVA